MSAGNGQDRLPPSSISGRGFIARAGRLSRKLPASRTKSRAGRVVTAVATHLGASPHCFVESSSGCRFVVDARSRTEAAMVWNGEYEPEYSRLLLDLATVYGTTIYDVGANVGLIGVPLARELGPDGFVACFEPVASNVERLRTNIELNHLANCRVFPVALGSGEGTVQLAREAGGGATTGNAVIMPSGDRPRNTEMSAVPLTRLDTVVASDQLPLPDVIKLDVEGSEVGFLIGAEETIEASRPIILGEFNSSLMPTFGTDFVDAYRCLPGEYSVFAFAGGDVLEERVPEKGLGDVLLVPREKVDRLPRATRG